MRFQAISVLGFVADSSLNRKFPPPLPLENADGLSRVRESGVLAGLGAVLLGEEDVVVLAGVEGRVEIDEVHRLVLDVALEDIEIVTVVELVFIGRHGVGMRLTH